MVRPLRVERAPDAGRALQDQRAAEGVQREEEHGRGVHHWRRLWPASAVQNAGLLLVDR